MRRRPLFGTLAIGGVTVLALTGCGAAGNTDTSGEGGGDAEEITALILSSAAYDPCSIELAATFEEETGIAVNLISEGFPTYHDKLLTTLSSSSDTYDVAMLAYQWTVEFADPGFLAPLSDQIADDDSLSGILENASSLYQFDGEQYAVPFSAQAETLFYRTDLFEQAGFEPPTTWEEHQEIVDFFTNNPDYPGVAGTSIRGATQHDGTNFNNRYFGLGGDALGEPGSEMDVDIATEALESLAADVAASPAGALGATFVETGAQMQSGGVAMIEAMPSTVLSLLKDESPENAVYGNVGLAPVPGDKGEAGGWGFVVPSVSQKQDAAFQFASYMSSEAADLQCYVEYGKPAVQAATYEAPEVAEAFYTSGIAEAVDSSMGKPSGATGARINNLLDDTVSRFLAGQTGSAADTAQQMADEYAELVE